MSIRLILTCAALYTVGGLCVLISAPPVLAQTQPIRVLFLGNSLTAGYGLPEKNAYPALLQAEVDSLQWPVIMINAGVSGDTSAGGLRRLAWQLEDPPDVLVVALGANDGLRGLPPSMTKANLGRIIHEARQANPAISILIAAMEVPPNMGPLFQEEFRRVFPSIATEMNTGLIPFLLDGVGGVISLNQSDGIHPTAEGQQIVARNVWEFLKPVLQKRILR